MTSAATSHGEEPKVMEKATIDAIEDRIDDILRSLCQAFNVRRRRLRRRKEGKALDYLLGWHVLESPWIIYSSTVRIAQLWYETVVGAQV
jgi:hypothetical protein